jgi:hypothetical protein
MSRCKALSCAKAGRLRLDRVGIEHRHAEIRRKTAKYTTSSVCEDQEMTGTAWCFIRAAGARPLRDCARSNTGVEASGG